MNKIALIKQKYHNYGGAEKNMAILAEGLNKRGYEVTVFCRNTSGTVTEGIRVEKVKVPLMPSFLRLLYFDYAVQKKLKKYKYDIVHSFEALSRKDIYRASGGCSRQWNRLLKEEGNSFLGRPALLKKLYSSVEMFMESRALKKGNYRKIIAISQRTKKEIMEYYDVPESDIRVIYNGVDLKEFNPANTGIFRDEIRKRYGIKPEEFTILFVGSGFLRKGLSSLIKAAASINVKKPGIRLIVAGGGKAVKYRQIADKLGMQGKVIFTGTFRDIKRLYAAADVFVLPSSYEPFGTAVLEALASGLPVVVSGVCGAGELINDNINGFIIQDCNNEGEIAKKIEAVFDSGLRNKISAAGRLLAEKYSSDKYIEETIELYRELAGR